MHPANTGIRYTKQYDEYSCGPTALINALKWAGHSVSYKRDIKTYRTRVQCSQNGTGVMFLGMALNFISHKIQVIDKYTNHYLFIKKLPKWKRIKEHLTQGGGLILRYDWPNGDDAHYILVTHLTQAMVGVVNYKRRGPSHGFIQQRTLRQLLQQKESMVCWLLAKTE